MDIDFKITAWERITIPNEHKEAVLERIKSGDITTGNDLHEFITQEEGTDENIDCITLKETETYIDPESNQGFATIDVLMDGETIYQNGKE